MGFKEGFFWGGATAANQYEGGYISGGKGLAIQDVITGGDGRNNIPRRMALKLADGSTKFIDRRGTEVRSRGDHRLGRGSFRRLHVQRRGRRAHGPRAGGAAQGR